MASWLRNSLYGSLGTLWLTGCAWLLLHGSFQRSTEFGSTPHPLQPVLLSVHGIVAVVAVFFVGWVAGTHIGANWATRFNRVSGLALLIAMGLLALTGWSGYYLTVESFRADVATVHEAIGVLAIAPALVHWARRGRLDSQRIA
jgi:heme A synthase